jgi:hypothetical protein
VASGNPLVRVFNPIHCRQQFGLQPSANGEFKPRRTLAILERIVLAEVAVPRQLFSPIRKRLAHLHRFCDSPVS